MLGFRAVVRTNSAIECAVPGLPLPITGPHVDAKAGADITRFRIHPKAAIQGALGHSMARPTHRPHLVIWRLWNQLQLERVNIVHGVMRYARVLISAPPA